MRTRVLVVGGAGSFGQRLVEGLLATTDVTVIVGGRTLHSRHDFITTLQRSYGQDRVEATRIDRDAAAACLQAAKPFCVVDAAGPFQGTEPHLARAAIAAGCHYVDLADARDFVMRFSALDGEARAAGVLAVTGASSTPALSGAAVTALTEGWQQIDEIAVAISPGNRAPRGLSVVEAILAYAGQPVRVWTDGQWTTRPGWGELIRRDMPGLGRRWLSLCETPDLDLLPARYPAVRDVRFRAGLELSCLHLGLWVLTLPVRAGWIRSLRPFAAALQEIAALFEPFGTDRGGMSVEARGRDGAGHPTLAIWSLVAEAGDGPNIPVLPALALIRGLLDGSATAVGAHIACERLSLAAIEKEFQRFRITARRDRGWPDAASLFERILGPDVEHLPPLVRRIHTAGRIRLRGRATISIARGWTGRLIARLFGFPAGPSDAPADVILERRGNREIWIRHFGRFAFRSVLSAGPLPHRLHERFGPFTLELGMTAHESGFDLAVLGWRIGSLRLPRRLAPQAPARAFVDGAGRYRFDVQIGLPWIGPLVRYQGWLEPEET